MIKGEIVLTGGPCGGKTTALDIIRNEFTAKGYRVLTCPELASVLIANGLSDIDNIEKRNPEAYLILENALYGLQKLFRFSLRSIAEQLTETDTIIVYDRAELDIAAYVSKRQFLALLASFDMTEQEVFDRYDAVLHLTTAADGAEEAYNLTNPSRREKVLEAAVGADKRIMEAWLGHPNHIIIDNSTDFTTKMTRVIKEIEKVVK